MNTKLPKQACDRSDTGFGCFGACDNCARSMRALSSQPPRFLNNLCASVWCLFVRDKRSNLCRKFASASYANFDTLFLGVPKRVPKITALNRIQAYFPGPLKKSTFSKKLRKKNLLDNNDILAPKAPYLKADFAEGEILPQQFPARELRAHLPRGSSLVL